MKKDYSTLPKLHKYIKSCKVSGKRRFIAKARKRYKNFHSILSNILFRHRKERSYYRQLQ